MKTKLSATKIPVITSQAGSALTYANWQREGVCTISIYLDELLMRPGFYFLDSLTSIRDLYAWEGPIALNAILAPPNQKGIYSFRSTYDGSLISIDIRSLVALIFKLQPDIVILPLEAAGLFYQFLVQKPTNMQVYIPQGENLPGLGVTAKAGLCLRLDAQKSFAAILEDITDKNKNFYLMGDFNLNQLRQLAEFSHCYVESNRIAEDGIQGIVYTKEGSISILDASMEDDFSLISKDCGCETCSYQLTRAYLHHLLQHTPLLAQRFLIQHNVWSWQAF
jgi:queuine tRNA-ribosyltransferase